MSAALPLWALDTGLVARVGDGAFELNIRNANTGVTAASRMNFVGGLAENAVIPGVDGAWPGVDLFLNEPVSAKTGKLLPTGNAVYCGPVLRQPAELIQAANDRPALAV